MRTVTHKVAPVLLLACLLGAPGCGLRTNEREPVAGDESAAPKGTDHGTAGPSPKADTPAAAVADMVLVPAGEFIMGDPAQPIRVTLKPFYMDRTEVTNAQYARFLEAAREDDSAWRHPEQPAEKTHHVPACWDDPNLGKAHGDHPVAGVDWFDAVAYAKWAGKRLPTEAEWERAARGTDGRIYPWGAAPPEDRGMFRANFFSYSFAADGHRFTAPAESFPEGASPDGCLQMAGNVTEWTADWYGELPRARRLSDPAGPETGTARVTKGGSWNVSAASLRSYRRWPMDPARGLSSVGFRCARDASER